MDNAYPKNMFARLAAMRICFVHLCREELMTTPFGDFDAFDSACQSERRGEAESSNP